MKKVIDLYNWIIEENLCSEETLSMVTHLMGMDFEVLNSVIFQSTGYRSKEQYLDAVNNY